MKYDCSKTLDFFHELVRQCHDITNASIDPKVVGCRLFGCSLAGKITQEQINELQKWSDEHTEKTLAGNALIAGSNHTQVNLRKRGRNKINGYWERLTKCF